MIEYVFEEEHLSKYSELLKSLHSSDSRLPLFLKEVSAQLSAKNPFFRNGTILNFIATEGNLPMAHCSAILDTRNKGVGLIGFFDCRSKEAGNIVLKRAISFLREKGCGIIRGPVNLTIWNNYRFIIQSIRKPEIFDPFCLPFYPEVWRANGFIEADKYVSAVRTNPDALLSSAELGYNECVKEYSIRRYNDEDFRSILMLANNIFKDGWNFVPLSFDEFSSLYDDLLRAIDTSHILIAQKAGEPVGFCFAFPNPMDKKQMIIKTIGVLSEHRQKHIAAAMLYLIHREKGFSEFYYPLIRKGNSVTKFPYKEYKIITEYAAYEFRL
jgi:hypothetical protein